MNIQGDIMECQSLKHEITVLSKRLKILREKARQSEERINVYLEETGQPGVKFRGTAIVREEKPKRKPKKKKDRKADAIYVLEKYGINDPENVLEELMEARRGSPDQKSKLFLRK